MVAHTYRMSIHALIGLGGSCSWAHRSVFQPLKAGERLRRRRRLIVTQHREDIDVRAVRAV